MDKLLKDIVTLVTEYKNLNVGDSIDWEKYNHYSLVHHSTSIEGSSLTIEETQLLLEENTTAKGKPLLHHNMQKDHYNALLFILDAAKNKVPVTAEFIKEIGARIMQNTGAIHNTSLGSFDSSKGDFRLLNVHAGSTRFVDFSKVPKLIDLFCTELNDKLKSIDSIEDTIITSFDAHFNLVSIHPFADGNGRVSRLIMNFVQKYFDIPLSNVFKEDKADYYKALVDTREKENPDIFREFMLSQYKKLMDQEINKVRGSEKEHIIIKSNRKGLGMSMIF